MLKLLFIDSAIILQLIVQKCLLACCTPSCYQQRNIMNCQRFWGRSMTNSFKIFFILRWHLLTVLRSGCKCLESFLRSMKNSFAIKFDIANFTNVSLFFLKFAPTWMKFTFNTWLSSLLLLKTLSKMRGINRSRWFAIKSRMRWDYGMLTPSHFIILSFHLIQEWENEFMTALTAHAIISFSLPLCRLS